MNYIRGSESSYSHKGSDIDGSNYHNAVMFVE